MLRTTSAEWTLWAIASAHAASTAGSPSVSTAVRMSTICRLPSSAPASLRRTRSIAAGSTAVIRTGGPTMLTAMTEEDWTIVLQVFDASRSRGGDKGRDLEALHYFVVHNITWRALPEKLGHWNS